MVNAEGSAKKRRGRALCLTKAVLLSYAVTSFMLLILAYLLFKFRLNEKIISASLTAIYFISAFSAGIIAGKCSDTRKFAWGLFAGIVYYTVLAVISYLILHSFDNGAKDALLIFLICAVGGTAGGMAAAAFQKK